MSTLLPYVYVVQEFRSVRRGGVSHTMSELCKDVSGGSGLMGGGAGGRWPNGRCLRVYVRLEWVRGGSTRQLWPMTLFLVFCLSTLWSSAQGVYSDALPNPWSHGFGGNSQRTSVMNLAFAVPDATGIQTVTVRDPYIQWKRTLNGHIHSSATVTLDGKMGFVATLHGSFFAFNTEDGSIHWQFNCQASINTSPVLSQTLGIVFIGCQDHRLYALNTTTGGVAYNIKTEAPIQSSAALSNDESVVMFGSDDGNLYAANAKSGVLSWKYKTGGAIRSSPAVSKYGNIVVFGSDDQHVHCVSVNTGEEKWKYATGSMVRSSPALTAAVYVGSGFGDNALHSLDLSSGRLRWKFQTKGGRQ